MNYRCCSNHCDDDILHLVDKDASGLLCLLQLERLHLYSKEIGLCVFPFPAAALLAVLELYLLHRGEKLISFVVVDGLLLKQLIVEHFPTAQEQHHPCGIKNAAEQEDGENLPVVEEQHHREHREAEK